MIDDLLDKRSDVLDIKPDLSEETFRGGPDDREEDEDKSALGHINPRCLQSEP